ncbi:MAG: hypothetical protein IPK52_11950 [Chloroflexi bacterium]|nr:hypothetical protein [Chloroflexota bacterium]
MTRFAYVFVALMVGGMTFLASALYGPDLLAMVMQLQYNAHPALGEVTTLITSPIVWALTNPALGAVLTGVLWPVAVFWVGIGSALGVVSVGYGMAINLTFDLGIGTFF